MNEQRYRIEPRFANLNIMPLHMRGHFRFKDAHLICSEWNSWHEAEEMVIPVEETPK